MNDDNTCPYNTFFFFFTTYTSIMHAQNFRRNIIVMSFFYNISFVSKIRFMYTAPFGKHFYGCCEYIVLLSERYFNWLFSHCDVLNATPANLSYTQYIPQHAGYMTNTGTQIVLIYLGQWLCYSYGRGEKRLWQIHNGYDHDRFHASRGGGLWERGT